MFSVVPKAVSLELSAAEGLKCFPKARNSPTPGPAISKLSSVRGMPSAKRTENDEIIPTSGEDQTGTAREQLKIKQSRPHEMN